MKYIFHTCWCIGFSLLVSCSSSKKITTKEYVLDTITVRAKNNPIDIYRASKTRYWDITHTRVALSFNLKEKTAAGKAWIRLHPYFYPSDTLVLDAKSMQIDSVLLTTNNTRPLKFSQSNEQLKIQLDRIYRNDETIQLYIKYTAKPYAAPIGGSAAITEDRGLYFINTNHEVPNKPVQIWTQGETESNSHWLPTIDQPNERFTVQVELTVPDNFKTLSNGVLIKREVADKGQRTDTWVIDKPIQTYAIMFAIGDFSIVEDKPWNDVRINYYVEPEYAAYAKNMFRNTREMIDYFSKITGVPYPWNKYSQIAVRDYVSGAMENTTATLWGEFVNQNDREIADKNYEDITAHELFHQWFGDYVTAESWSNITLNESFANYSEQLWRTYKYSKASNDELAFNDLNKYLSSASYNDEPLTRFHYNDKEDLFDRISYEKGGAVLHYLHGLTGDDAFYKAMNIYLTKNALQPAETHNWRMAVEEATGKDWNWFFDQWYYRGGHPSLNIQYEYDDKNNQLVVSVIQTVSDSLKAYNLPLKAALIYGDGKEIIDWNIDSKKQKFTYSYRNNIKPIFIPDQEHWLPGTISENKKTAQWLAQLKQSDDYINKRKAISGAFLAQSDSTAQIIFHDALKDSIAGIRTHALNLLERMNDRYAWYKNFENEIAFLAINDGNHRVRAAAFDVLGKWKIESSKEDMIHALTDSSYMVAGAALGALRKITKDTAYFFAKQIYAQNPKADLEDAIWSVIASTGKADDIKLFSEKAPYVYGSKKMSFAAFLNLYSFSTKDIDAFEQALNILTNLAKNESIKSYRFAVGAMVYASENYYKEQVKTATDKNKLADIYRRQEIIEKYKVQILANETDPDNIKKYKSFNDLKGAY